jgi:hypothetical protein
MQGGFSSAVSFGRHVYSCIRDHKPEVRGANDKSRHIHEKVSILIGRCGFKMVVVICFEYCDCEDEMVVVSFKWCRTRCGHVLVDVIGESFEDV